jgi:hypothetical protein
MSLTTLRQLAEALRDSERQVGPDRGRPQELRVLSPLVLEAVHEIVNLETMIAALERRLEKLEGRNGSA